MSLSNNVPVLGNVGVAPGTMSGYRNVMPPTQSGYIPAVVSSPALPPRPEFISQNNNYGMNQGYAYAAAPMGSYGMSGIGSYGMGPSMGGYGGYGGMGGMGSYGGYNGGGFGMGGMNAQNPYGYGNVESRFIQMAEENSRPAFESIQSLVYAVGGVSMMLENTFFALTSSFRAILGVAENFGRLRSLFAQFWTTFGMFRSINWLIRKLSVIIGIRTEAEFKAWAEAVAATQAGTATQDQRTRSSSWPVVLFFAVIAAAPYLLLKMMSGVSSSTDSLWDPKTWRNPMKAVAQESFQASSSQELSFNRNQVLWVAPEVLQGNFWNSGWLMATTDGVEVGLIPVNFIRIIVQNDPNAAPRTQNNTAPVNPNQKPETGANAQNQDVPSTP